MTKLENQAMLVTALKAFTGKLPPGYADEIEFFLTSLKNMEEYLVNLQSETLKEACDSFIRKLDAGKVTLQTIDDFKAVVDKLISTADFRLIIGSMAGSKETIKQRMQALKPISIIGEGRKVSGADPETERHINGAYNRLNFEALAGRVKAAPDDFPANYALAKARAEVAEYCCLYRVQLTPADTLTPFSMSCVDAALAASYRLFNKVRRASGRTM